MCGIAGMIGLDYNENVLNDMLKTMLHRGPDGNGIYREPGCGLIHSRLAIIDPSGGAQPMELTWCEEHYVMVYNGELYNTLELRRELELYGHEFYGHSDSEVLLHAYAQWSVGALERLNGIYAFAVWHVREKKLFLARDRMGVKPLFYKLHDSGLIFASEIKTILAYPTVSAELDAEGVTQILMLGPGRVPGSGVFRGVKEIEPGFCGYFYGNQWHYKRYWKLRDREHAEDFQQTAEHVRQLILDAVKRQMVSDVPIGTFLSGGLDSSLISSICSCEMKEKGERLNTFSVDYVNNKRFFIPGKFQPNTDSDYIHIMVEYLNADQHKTELTPQDLIDHLMDATIARDLPGMADVDFSLMAFCKEIRKNVKVALSGECADEIFGGYPWYRDPKIRETDGFPWSQNIELRSNLLLQEHKRKANPVDYVRSYYADTIMDSDILPGTNDLERRMKQLVNLNLRWFMQTLLDRKDRMSMYCGLEVRVPFCDHRIAEYLYGVPWAFKDYNGVEKGLLRYAAQDILPEKILWRKKSPYPKTYDPQYTMLVKQMLDEIMGDSKAPIFQIISHVALNRMFETPTDWPWYGQLMRLPQTMAFMVQLNFWLEHYKVTFV